MIEARFGASSPWSLGVEEELMILDAETLAQTPAVADLIAAAEELDLPGRLKTELHASVVELNTDVSATAHEAGAKLTRLRATADEVARARGLRVAAAGTHPFSRPEEQEIVNEQRYREMVEYVGPTARRQGVNGLHVHVGMPSADACMHALEAVLPWLPVVLALSANSPYVAGVETGFASSRAQVLLELPRSGAPPLFVSYSDWEEYVERVGTLRLPADYTALWWDIRPHPRFGTLEVRMPDQPTSLARTIALVALIQALCVTALEQAPPRPRPRERGLYQQNRWAAARFGPRAELIAAGATRRVAASELARELLEFVAPASTALGTSDLLSALDPDRCEADVQLEVARADGTDALCADLVDRSLVSGR